jgi:hypothetical protein
MSELPIGVSYQTLLDIVAFSDRGNTLPEAFLMAGIYSEQESVIRNKTAYWFLFDNLNRDAAQELWVRAWKYNRFRLENSRDSL